MSADIWLEYPDGRVVVDDDPDAEMRDLIPRRAPAELSDTTFNLTYNLTPMLRRAGMPPWQDFIGTRAELAGVIWRSVHTALLADPEVFQALNPPNGWGDYDGAVEVIGALADACERFPNAVVGGWL